MKISEVLAIQEKLKETSAPVKKSKPKAKPNSKKALKVVRTKETPNPNALQFVINAVLLDNGNISFASKKEAEGDKMATALFMVVTTIAALGWQAYQFFTAPQPNLFLGTVAVVLIALAVFVGYEAMQSLKGRRRIVIQDASEIPARAE